MNEVVTMYLTLAPVILSGILNMVWCKLPVVKKWQIPIDSGKSFKDGKRIFGDNKTWKGFFGYVWLSITMYGLWGFVSSKSDFLMIHNYFYYTHSNHFNYNISVGALLGFGYAVFELPNSFLKRRLDIEPGKTISGFKKVFFIFLDQADSVIGCAFVVWLFYDIGMLRFVKLVVLGAVTHIFVNMLLYLLGLRKNMF